MKKEDKTGAHIHSLPSDKMKYLRCVKNVFMCLKVEVCLFPQKVRQILIKIYSEKENIYKQYYKFSFHSYNIASVTLGTTQS